MDPITIGLLAASIGGGLYASSSASDQAQENLEWQKQQAAEQMRFAQAGRTDAFGNRVSYDKALNEWITSLTPAQKALMFAGETEQRRALSEDAARNRAVRERLFRMGKLAQPGFDEALAKFRYDQPESEASTRGKLAQLLTAAKSSEPGDTSPQALRTAGNLPSVTRSPMGDTGASQLAKTLLQARGQALTETGARQNVNASRYGNALGTYANLLSGGGGAPITMPTTAKDLEGQQADMARLVASVGASSASNVGNAQQGALKAASMNPIDARALASIYGAGAKYAGKATPTNVGSATRFGDDPYASDWLTSTQSVPGDNWYF